MAVTHIGCHYVWHLLARPLRWLHLAHHRNHLAIKGWRWRYPLAGDVHTGEALHGLKLRPQTVCRVLVLTALPRHIDKRPHTELRLRDQGLSALVSVGVRAEVHWARRWLPPLCPRDHDLVVDLLLEVSCVTRPRVCRIGGSARL